MIQLFSNSMGREELDAINRVFHTGWTGFGKECELFEKKFGERIGSNNVLMTNCCTASLFMAMKILDIGYGDEVIIPSINFIGCVTAIESCGAIPIFADVDLNTLNIIPNEILRLKSTRTKAVLLLHYGGHPAQMDAIKEICDKYSLYIIEDSANSIVSKYYGQNCGTIGDVGCFSFDAMKILSCGDGGAIVVNDTEKFNLAKKARYFGITNGETGFDSMAKNETEWWKFDIEFPSNRYKPNDITAAMANEQLKKLDGFISRRKEIWDTYQKELSNIEGIIIPPEPLPNCESSYYLYWLQFYSREIRNEVARYLRGCGIYTSFRYYPLHLIQHYFDRNIRLKNSEWIADHTLNVPLHQNLTDQEILFICEKVKWAIR